VSKLLLDFRVPDKYNKQAITDLIRQICNQVNALSEGRLSARYQASTAIPSGSAVSYARSDIVWDSNATQQGTAGAKYVRIGWICTTDGSPGTFQEMRVLTGN